jgi:hypothetical protein
VVAENIGRVEVSVTADGKGFAADAERQIRDQAPGFEKAGKEVGKKFASGLHDENDKQGRSRLRRFRAFLAREANKFERVGAIIGRAFGRGSRNDFLNLFGGFVSLGPRVIGLLATIGSLAVSKFRSIQAEFTRLREAGSSVVGALTNLAGQGLVGLVAALASVGVALYSTIALMGPLGAAISLLTGLVLALAGSLGFALVGALGAAAGAILPLAAGIGVLVLSLTNLDKKSKVFKNLKKDFKDLQKQTQQRLFGRDLGGLKVVNDVLKALEPVIFAVADALNKVLTTMGKAVQGKEFRDLMSQIAAVIGPMVGQLGRIAGFLILGLGRAFIALSPIIKEFLGWLEDISKGFAEAGKGGTNSDLAGFFNRAWDSAKKLAGLVKEIGGLLLDLLGAGQPTGDSIIVSLTKNVKKLRDWLTQAKESGQLQQWFEDAKKFGEKIGKVVKKILELIDALDTPTSRTLLDYILDVATTALGILTSIVKTIDTINTKVIDVGVSANTEGLSTLKQRLGELPGEIKGLDIGGAIGRGFESGKQRANEAVEGIRPIPGKIAGFFSGLGGKIIAKAGDLKGGFERWSDSLAGRARTVASQVTGAFGGLGDKMIAKGGDLKSRFERWSDSLPGKARSLATRISSGFSGLATKMMDKAGSIASAIGRWASGVGAAAGRVADSIVRAFSGLAGRIINAIGTIVPRFSLPNIKGNMAGGIYSQPGLGTFAEDGRAEAIVPLQRPLSQVDPAVRELAAFAQGKLNPKALRNTNPAPRGEMPPITIITPTKDPYAVAGEVFARFAGVGYL